MNRFYQLVAQRAGNRCEYCRAPERVFNFLFEVDHYIPISKGGIDDLENLVLACRSCNAYKAFHQMGLINEGDEIPLYNPRVNTWDEHFLLNAETFEIEGLTDVGRGTINRLKYNSSEQIPARALWIEMNLFP